MPGISARVAKALPIRKWREICHLSAEIAFSTARMGPLENGEEKLSYYWQ
jgi:hypothetical protein